MLISLPTHHYENICKITPIKDLYYLFPLSGFSFSNFSLYWPLVLSKKDNLKFAVSHHQSEIIESFLPNEIDDNALIFPDYYDLQDLKHLRAWARHFKDDPYAFDIFESTLIMQCFIHDALEIYQILKKKSQSTNFKCFYLVGLYYISLNNSIKILEYLIENDYDSIIEILKKDDYFKYFTHIAIKNGSGSVWDLLSRHYLFNRPFHQMKFMRELFEDQIAADVKKLYMCIPCKDQEREAILKEYDLILRSYVRFKVPLSKLFDDRAGIYFLIRLVAFANDWELIEMLVEMYASEKDFRSLHPQDLLQNIMIGFSMSFDHHSKHEKALQIQNFFRKAQKSLWFRYSAKNYDPSIKSKAANDLHKFTLHIKDNLLIND